MFYSTKVSKQGMDFESENDYVAQKIQTVQCSSQYNRRQIYKPKQGLYKFSIINQWQLVQGCLHLHKAFNFSDICFQHPAGCTAALAAFLKDLFSFQSSPLFVFIALRLKASLLNNFSYTSLFSQGTFPLFLNLFTLIGACLSSTCTKNAFHNCHISCTFLFNLLSSQGILCKSSRNVASSKLDKSL